MLIDAVVHHHLPQLLRRHELGRAHIRVRHHGLAFALVRAVLGPRGVVELEERVLPVTPAQGRTIPAKASCIAYYTYYILLRIIFRIIFGVLPAETVAVSTGVLGVSAKGQQRVPSTHRLTPWRIRRR